MTDPNIPPREEDPLMEAPPQDPTVLGESPAPEEPEQDPTVLGESPAPEEPEQDPTVTGGPVEVVSGELPPLVQVKEDGELQVDFAGALEHVPGSIIRPEEFPHAAEQLRQRVGQIMAEKAAQDLADEILALTSPEPEIVETAGGGETVATPPQA